MDVARDRRDRSSVLSSPGGALEYAQRGKGPAIVIVHGAGGGFDQAFAFSRLLCDSIDVLNNCVKAIAIVQSIDKFPFGFSDERIIFQNAQQHTKKTLVFA